MASPRNPHNAFYQYDPTRDPNSDTYIDRRGTVDTGAEQRQQAEQHVNRQVDEGGFLAWLMDKFNHGERVQETYTQNMNATAESLAQGVDTRQGPIMSCTNYMARPHTELKPMVTEDAQPDQVGEAGDKWIKAGNEMVNFQNAVGAAITNSETDWQGGAGDSARTFMAQMGNWVGAAGQSAQLAGTQTNLQSAALSDAKRNMPEPVNFDLNAAIQDMQSSTNPLELVTKVNNIQQQYNAQQAAHQEAAQVVGVYDSSLASASTMPAFGPPPTMGTASISQTQVQQSEIGQSNTNNVNTNNNVGTTGTGSRDANGPTGTVDTPPTTGDQGGPGGSDGSGGGSGGSGSGSGGSGSGSGGPGGGNGTTTPSNDLPGGPPVPTPLPPPGSGNQQNPGVPGPPMPITAMPGGNPGDFERGRSGYGGGRGFGPGGGFGSGPGGGPGSGPGGSAAGQNALGRGAGVGGMGPGGALAAAESAAARGGAGARGAGGMMPFGGGGQRGQGDDDDEHQRPSFLVEGDPDAVFGTDEVTAPPVIGE